MPDPIDVVIDILHHNGNVNLGKAAVAGIMGVIQKARQGQAGANPAYKTNPQSSRRGTAVGRLSVGSHGVGRPKTSSASSEMIPTLCWSSISSYPTRSSMTLEGAKAFLTHVQQVARRNKIACGPS